MYEAGSIDCILDKGMLDSILGGYESGPNAEILLDQVYKVLSSNGVYIMVSYGTKDMRLGYLKNSNLQWNVQVY